jgi:tripartite-type tricarboxylate transporter receptor subunit TctC
VVERLYRAVAVALSKDAVRAAMAKQGIPAALRTPAEVAAMLPGEVEKWAAVIKTANVTVN